MSFGSKILGCDVRLVDELAKVLLIDDERFVRTSVRRILEPLGYDIVEAKDGEDGIVVAFQEEPDVIILDFDMPVMDGWAVLAKLKETTLTRTTPVIMLTSHPVTQGEEAALHSGADHFMPKPWDSDTVALTVKVALRESSRLEGLEQGSSRTTRLRRGPGLEVSLEDRDGGHGAKLTLDDEKPEGVIEMGDALSTLGKILGEGLPEGGPVLIEGATGTGKSVLSQHIAHGAVANGCTVAYFSSQFNEQSLTENMSSMLLDVSEFLESNQLTVYPLERVGAGEDSGYLLSDLVLTFELLPPEQKLIIVDAITDYVTSNREQATFWSFMARCKRACSQGRTIILTVDPYAFDTDTLKRVSTLCDTHLSLASEKMRGKVVKTMEALKVDTTNLTSDNTMSFVVEPEMGLRIIPLSRAKV